MINVRIQITHPVANRVDLGAIANAVNSSALALANRFPQSELWEITSIHDRSRYSVRSPLGEKKSKVQAIGIGANSFRVGQIVQVFYYDRDRSRPYIKGGLGWAEWGSALLTGIWDEQWGSLYKNAVASLCTVDFNDWPGSQVATYATDTGGATGKRTNPQGMLVLPGGHFLLGHRMNTNPSATPVSFRLRLYTPISSWSQVFSVDISFALDRDKQTANYHTDCQMIYDAETTIVTVFSRCYDSFPGSVTASDKCSVWSVEIPQAAIDSADGSLCSVLATEITLSDSSSDRLAMNCCSVAAGYMIKGNLLLDKLRGFEHVADVGWSDLWTLEWSTVLKERLFGTAYFVSYGQSGSAVGVSSSFNIGPPAVMNGGYLCWCLVASSRDGDIFSQQSDLWEMLIRADTGEFHSHNRLWTLTPTTYADMTQIGNLMTDLDTALKASITPPSPNWGGSTVTSHGVTDDLGNPQSVSRTTSSIWLGPLYAGYSVNYTDSSGNAQTEYLPGPSDVTSASPVQHSLIPVMLPGPYPNTAITTRWVYGFDTPIPLTHSNVNARALATDTGWRFYAGMVPVGPFSLGSVDLNSDTILKYKTVESYTDLGVGWTPRWFKNEVTNYGGSLANPQFVQETHIFSVSPQGLVTSRPLLERHSPVNYSYPYSTGTSITVPIPVPENVYQVIYVSQIDRIFWLHDARTSYESDPTPMITVTDKDLNIAYTIPSSALFSITLFSADQFLTASPTVAWAYDGQDTRKRHSVDNGGPLMKAYVNGSDNYLVVGTESYDFVEPVTGSTGTTYSRTQFIQVTAVGYSVAKTTTTTDAWTYPNITSGSLNGPSVIRNMAFLEDRIVFRRASNSLREVM